MKTTILTYWLTIALAGLAFLGGFGNLQAQNLCANPLFPGEFSLSKDKVCVGSPVTITNVPNTIINAKYSFQYDSKSSLTQIVSSLSATTTYTYSQPGSYTVLQAGSGNNTAGGTFLCKVVTVLPLDPIKFTAKACSGRRASITPDLSTLGQYDLYEIYWGDGVRVQKTRAEMTTDLSHTYTNAGTYTITVQGIYNAPVDCRSTLTKSDPITVTAAVAQPIITSLKTTSDKAIDIQYQAGSGISVQLYQKVNGSYTATGQNGSGSGTFTVQTDAKQSQCFQIATQDVCSGLGVQSEEVCSLVLDVKAANKQNNLIWQPYAGSSTDFRYYRIYRGSGINGQVTGRSTNSYADANNIMCGVQYCYSIEATAGPTTITSAAICVTGVNGDVPGNLGNTVVSIESNHPRLVATLPTSNAPSTYTLVISRSSGSTSTFEPIGTVVNKNTFTDETVDPSAGSYCYEVAYQSGCGLVSVPTPPVCTVWLSSKSDTGIDWTAEAPFSKEKLDNYTIEVIDSVNNTRQEIPSIINTHYDLSSLNLDVQSQKYRIIAVSEFGTVSYSNFFVFRREAKILVPDAFTPGNDNINETFEVKGVYFDQFRMTIYDRWGEVIYTTTDKKLGWDGKINGQIAQAGQYMYRVEVTDTTGLKTVRTGAVLLIR